jgi:DNA-binding NarL/FixJ family response regulator
VNEYRTGRRSRENHHLAGKRLGRRELQCLALIAEGYSNPEIAEALSTTSATVKGYVQRLMAKLEANDRAHAVYLALKSGVLDAEQLGGEAA